MNRPIEVAERALLQFFPPADGSQFTNRKAFSEADFRTISGILRRTGRESWSNVPRMYTILRLIDQLHLLDSVVAEGISDAWLPFTVNSLPEVINSMSARSRFLEVQRRVLTKSLGLEKENCQHLHFADIEDIPFIKVAELGKGGFGYVDRVVSTISHKEYARKLIPRGRTFKKNKTVLQEFEQELAILKKLSHPHIVQLVGSYTDPKFVGILMSPIADCNLKEFLQQDSLSEEGRSILQTFFGCLASGLCYLHENHVRHKDIKPENILIKAHTVYLTDFGLSLDWSESGHSTTSDVTARTPRYCAPEVAECAKKNSLSDIWSLGCVFLEIWTVLKGKPITTLISHLGSVGTHSTYYHQNFSAIQDWYSILKDSAGSLANSVPLKWIEKMIQLSQSDRCAAQTLCGYIQDANIDPENRFKFSGDCCIEADDASESLSSHETTDFLHEAMQASVERDENVVDQSTFGGAERSDQRAFQGGANAHSDILNTFDDMALNFYLQGKYDEAEKLDLQALKGRQKVLGIEHPKTLRSLNNLAQDLRMQRKYDEAEKLDLQALKGRQKVLGMEHPYTLDSLNHLATDLRGQGKFEEAGKLYEELLKARQKLLGMEHPDTLESLQNLAGDLRGQGKFEEAGKLYEELLKARQKVLGIEHHALASPANLAGDLQE